MTAADIPSALHWDVSHAKRTLRGQPLPILRDALRIESQRPRPLKRLQKWIISRIQSIIPQPPMSPPDQPTTINHRQPPPTTANAAQPPRHGGPRLPGPGKKLGRPKKPKKDKVAVLNITLSSPRARTALKRKARNAKLTPGALIERDLKL